MFFVIFIYILVQFINESVAPLGAVIELYRGNSDSILHAVQQLNSYPVSFKKY